METYMQTGLDRWEEWQLSANIGRGRVDGAEDLMEPGNVFSAPCDSVPQLVRPKLRVTECEMVVWN